MAPDEEVPPPPWDVKDAFIGEYIRLGAGAFPASLPLNIRTGLKLVINILCIKTVKIKFAIEKKFFNSRISMLNGLIAQSVEQLTLNQLVEGSNPSEPIKSTHTNECFFDSKLFFVLLLTSI